MAIFSILQTIRPLNIPEEEVRLNLPIWFPLPGSERSLKLAGHFSVQRQLSSSSYIPNCPAAIFLCGPRTLFPTYCHHKTTLLLPEQLVFGKAQLKSSSHSSSLRVPQCLIDVAEKTRLN